MSADSSYAECHGLRDQFDKTWLENSETRAFISRPIPHEITLRTRFPSPPPSLSFCEIARSNRVCMEIEYKLLETQFQFPAIIRHLRKRLPFQKSHLLHYSVRISSNFLHHMSSSSLFDAYTSYIIPPWTNAESQILDLIR